MKILILTPFAKDGVQNSGDDLIIKSLIELIKVNNDSNKNLIFDIVSIAKSTKNKNEIFKHINLYKYNAILMPGFRVSVEGDENLDIRLKYLDKAIRFNIPVFILGCSWCVYPGVISQTELKMNSYEKALLRYIIASKSINYISARDIYTKKFMENNGIKCEVTGDAALFDPNKIDNELIISSSHKLSEIKKVAISLPHNVYHYKEVGKLKKMLEKYFNFEVFLVTHQILPEEKMYKKYINLSGNADNLDFYNRIDMHIGFRLHGHKWFLKNRKPSFLIAEDGRGWGHLATFNGLGIHAAPKYIKNKINTIDYYQLRKEGQRTEIDINLILDILKEEIENDFLITKSTLNDIDILYRKNVKIIKKILEA